MEYPQFSCKTRSETLRKLRSAEQTFDAVIVGGGIVGASLARELQIRGLRALLVEKSDFAGGTSSKSSKLIHGGLRYLEMLDFGLVFESLGERHWLLQTHPHLVQPLEFNIPIYGGKFAPKAARNSTLLGMGLWLYDALSLFRTPFFHGRHAADETAKLFPNLRREGLRGSFYYADAMMLDDELVLETLLDAFRRGASALNYVKATTVSERSKDGLFEVELEDVLPAVKQEGAGDHGFKVKAREVIVCVGPWTDRIDTVVAKGAKQKMKPSKGVHVLIPWKRFPVERTFVMFAPDGRLVFAIPRRDLGPGAEMVMIGTTDSPIGPDEKLEDIQANRKDVDYLLNILQSYFPDAKITDDDIVMTFAGVRPLIDSGDKSEAKTSREHEIWRNEAGIVFMAGGKYTTFRKISDEIAGFAFPKSKSRNGESKTQLSNPEDYKKRFEGAPLWGKFTEGWVRWKIEHHAPCTLEDIVFRRVPIWMAGRKLDARLIDRIAEIARPYFGWNDKEFEREKARVREGLKAGYTWNS